MILADVHLSDLILTTLWLFFLFMFIWVFIVIVSDLFRDHSLSGWAKAIWIVALILFPLIGSLVYLIARGPSMAERSAREQEQARAQFDSYVREAAGSSGSPAVDDLSRLAALRDNGTITEAEFESMKSRVTGGAGASA
jgi:hypothetical protein